MIQYIFCYLCQLMDAVIHSGLQLLIQDGLKSHIQGYIVDWLISAGLQCIVSSEDL